MTPDLPLRDIHLPEPVSWWPPAPGWWLATALIIGTIAFITYIIRHRYQQKIVQRTALSELNKITHEFQQHRNKLLLSQQLSSLLRRTAISVQPRHMAAGLTGKDWLAFLDRLAGMTLFNNDTGQQLIHAPYQPRPDLDAETLLVNSRTWIQCVSKRGRHA